MKALCVALVGPPMHQRRCQKPASHEVRGVGFDYWRPMCHACVEPHRKRGRDVRPVKAAESA